MRILYVATVRSHIGQFHMHVIQELIRNGHTVHAAFRDNSKDKKGLDLSCIQQTFEVPFHRSPFHPGNLKAFSVLKRIIDQGCYDIIHCHTPVGGVLTRLAAGKARKGGTKVIYTAHGFHFYKGAPLVNWLVYYPVEKVLARRTDVLITINREDYERAVSSGFRAGRITLVNGTGVDLARFSIASPEEKAVCRKEYGFPEKAFIMLYAADLSVRKNQQMILKALAKIRQQVPDLLLLLPGQPVLKDRYEKMCGELGISHMVRMPGYRRDIDRLLTACDCVISSSRQEGLPLNLIEAAARGKYIISTDIRGSRDVVLQSGFGCLVPLNNIDAMADEIKRAYREGCGINSDISSLAVYDCSRINRSVLDIYAACMAGQSEGV